MILYKKKTTERFEALVRIYSCRITKEDDIHKVNFKDEIGLCDNENIGGSKVYYLDDDYIEYYKNADNDTKKLILLLNATYHFCINARAIHNAYLKLNIMQNKKTLNEFNDFATLKDSILNFINNFEFLFEYLYYYFYLNNNIDGDVIETLANLLREIRKANIKNKLFRYSELEFYVTYICIIEEYLEYIYMLNDALHEILYRKQLKDC